LVGNFHHALAISLPYFPRKLTSTIISITTNLILTQTLLQTLKLKKKWENEIVIMGK